MSDDRPDIDARRIQILDAFKICVSKAAGLLDVRIEEGIRGLVDLLAITAGAWVVDDRVDAAESERRQRQMQKSVEHILQFIALNHDHPDTADFQSAVDRLFASSKPSTTAH